MDQIKAREKKNIKKNLSLEKKKGGKETREEEEEEYKKNKKQGVLHKKRNAPSSTNVAIIYYCVRYEIDWNYKL